MRALSKTFFSTSLFLLLSLPSAAFADAAGGPREEPPGCDELGKGAACARDSGKLGVCNAESQCCKDAKSKECDAADGGCSVSGMHVKGTAVFLGLACAALALGLRRREER